MAKLLRVPTGQVSLIPQSIEGNRLRMGYVETGKADILRDALIGASIGSVAAGHPLASYLLGGELLKPHQIRPGSLGSLNRAAKN